MGELGGDGSLDDLAAIIDWMRRVEGKSWQQVATALGEKVGFIRHVSSDSTLNTYKRIRRLRARALGYARRKMNALSDADRERSQNAMFRAGNKERGSRPRRT